MTTTPAPPRTTCGARAARRGPVTAEPSPSSGAARELHPRAERREPPALLLSTQTAGASSARHSVRPMPGGFRGTQDGRAPAPRPLPGARGRSLLRPSAAAATRWRRTVPKGRFGLHANQAASADEDLSLAQLEPTMPALDQRHLDVDVLPHIGASSHPRNPSLANLPARRVHNSISIVP